MPWSQADVRCPFYVSDKRKNIVVTCEGVTDKCKTKLSFKRIDQRDEYMGEYCVHDFTKCAIYNMLCDLKYPGVQRDFPERSCDEKRY